MHQIWEKRKVFNLFLKLSMESSGSRRSSGSEFKSRLIIGTRLERISQAVRCIWPSYINFVDKVASQSYTAITKSRIEAE